MTVPAQAGAGDGAHPVHDEDLADVEPLLELLGGDGHRVEETKAPVWKNRKRETVPRVQQDISSESMSQNHHMDLRSLKGRSPDLSSADQLFNVDTLVFQNSLSHENTKLAAFPRKA